MPLDRSQLEHLRAWRVPRERPLSLGPDLVEAARSAKRQATHFNGLSEAWGLLCPPALAQRTELAALVRGVLCVRVDNPATRFEVDRWLRGGGETELIKRCSTLLKVRLVA